MAKKAIPLDSNRRTVQLVPAVSALAVTSDDSISSSTEVTLNADTTFVEITAVSGGVYLRWGTSDASSSNFDEYIAAGVTRHYYVPAESNTTLYTALNVIEDDSGAGVRIIEK